jgi:hypothetical protein
MGRFKTHEERLRKIMAKKEQKKQMKLFIRKQREEEKLKKASNEQV